MLAVTQIYLELLLGAGVETEVRLIGEVVRVEEDPDETRLRDKGLRLLRLAAKDTRILAVVDLGLGVSIDYLEQRDREGFIRCVLAPKLETR